MKSKLIIFISIFIFSFGAIICNPVSVASAESPQERADALNDSPLTSNLSVSKSIPAFLMLVGIPGIPDASVIDLKFGDYINALYRLAISIAALLAVFKIVIAGAKYMLDDVVTHKSEAKAEIQGALVGLLVILSAFLVLNTINTDITKNIIAVDPVVGADGSNQYQKDFLAAVEALKATCSKALEAGNNCQTQQCTAKPWSSAIPGVGIVHTTTDLIWQGFQSCKDWCNGQKGEYYSSLVPGFDSCTWVVNKDGFNVNTEEGQALIKAACATDSFHTYNSITKKCDLKEAVTQTQLDLTHLTFATPTIIYTQDDLDTINSDLGVKITSGTDILGVITVPLETLQTANANNITPAAELDIISKNLNAACSGTIAYNKASINQDVDFYCLKNNL